MVNRIPPDYLKIFKEEEPVKPAVLGGFPEFNQFCDVFSRFTGVKLDVEEVAVEDQLTFPWKSASAPIKVSAKSTARSKSSSLSDIQELEAALGGLLGLITETNRQLQFREAELAAAVPVVSVEEDGKHLATRLNAVLRGAAEILNCFGAGLYMLDEATTSLKLRSAFGLMPDAMRQPARLLEDASADVEALAGHAIVIDDISMQSQWTIPEPCQAAMCIPVATATTILGTLWMYRDHAADFSVKEQNIAEITAVDWLQI